MKAAQVVVMLSLSYKTYEVLLDGPSFCMTLSCIVYRYRARYLAVSVVCILRYEKPGFRSAERE